MFQGISKCSEMQNSSLKKQRTEHFDIWDSFLHVIIYKQELDLETSKMVHFGPHCILIQNRTKHDHRVLQTAFHMTHSLTDLE